MQDYVIKGNKAKREAGALTKGESHLTVLIHRAVAEEGDKRGCSCGGDRPRLRCVLAVYSLHCATQI